MGDNLIDGSLTEKQQIRLSAWAEGQSGAIGSFLARRDFERSSAARDFVLKFKEAGLRNSAVLKESAAKNGAGIDLWGDIERRIGEEERSLLLLGERAMQGRRWSLKEALSQLKWGMAGAIVAACATIVIGNFYNSGATGRGAFESAGNLPGRGAASYVPVSSGGAGSGEDPVFYSMAPHGESLRSGPVFEVDWMRSKSGHVRMLKGPGGAPVIWIKRSPDAPVGAGKENIQIVESSVPEAIPVSER